MAYFPSFFAPYFDRACLRSWTPRLSSTPRTMWYRTPGRSRTRPPRTRTIECSWRLWPSPPMYAVISLPLDSRTRATFRSAEFGFFGVIVLTWRQTPRLNGQASSTGDLVLYTWVRRGFRTSWLIVGMSRWFRSPRPAAGVVPSRVALGRGVRSPGRRAWASVAEQGEAPRNEALPAWRTPKLVSYRIPAPCQVERAG